MTKSNSAFTLREYTSGGGYSHFEAYIYANTEACSPSDKRAKIYYQANRETPLDFYGGHLEIECRGMVDFDDLSKLLRRVFKPEKPKDGCYTLPGEFSFQYNPVGVLERLRDNLPQVAYDSRFHKYIPIAEVLPRSFHSYRDNWNRVDYGDGSTGCTHGCVAETDDDARRLITIQFCEHQSNFGNSKDRFEKWMAAGRPVLQLDDHHYGYPDFVKVEDLIAKITEAKAKEKAAA